MTESSANIDVSLVPAEVVQTIQTLINKGFEAFLVGGCVRDLILGRTPKDWDITTGATPDEIIASFGHTFYENKFGTVGIVYEKEGVEDFVIEATPYRTEGEYTDGRRPNSVSFSKNVHDDLIRRDFTMNAIAYNPVTGAFVDDHRGIKDIKDKVIRAVGDATERFLEDGLRVMRAVRFASELGFTINNDTEKALFDCRNMLGKIAKERIREEFNKLLMSDIPMAGIFMLQRYGLLTYIVPELEEGLNTEQNQAHSYTVYEHLLRSLQCAADKKYSLEMRLSALFHDIGKPKSRRYSEEKRDYTFYGHEVIGAKMTEKILKDLKYPTSTIEKVVKLVRWHMFFSDTAEISLSAVRRMVVNVGKDNIWDLMNLRICDRVGTGRPKENPYRFRKYKAMLEQVLRDPITVGMLKIDGNILMKKLHMEPGPRIGMILNALLEEVLENPTKNTGDYLEQRAKELGELDIHVLKKLGDSGKEAREAKEKEVISEIQEKYAVK
ncbi:MAG: CCA tRNA nucleotidyltransferase [Candidatus Taylorbacteria bacterium]|nr:CCA tRNA nucleotidyltransferase [Candidatus Taylorbacteria bacterium]